MLDELPVDLDVDYALWPKQEFAFQSPATEILYGGASGGGKSHLLRVAAIIWCMDIPGLKVGLFRRNYKELLLNHMDGSTGFPALLAEAENKGLVSITQKRMVFHNHSYIELHHLHDTKSLRKYQGPEFHVLLIDELTHFLRKEYLYLLGRVRMPEEMKERLPEEYKGMFPRILCGSNPGGVGHDWVKQRFVQKFGQDPFEPLTLYNYRGIKEEGGKMRQYIPARLEDNPSLDEEEYGATLEGLGDPVLIRALREGDWNIAEGAMFSEQWRETKIIDGERRWWHVHPGFRIPMDWPLWRGADDGYENPAACYWGTEDPERGTIYIVDELYKNHMLADEYAQRVLERDMEIPMQDAYGNDIYNTTRLRGALDTSAFTDTGQSDKEGQKKITRGEQMNRLGCKWEPVQKWPGSRVAGVQNFHRLLAPMTKFPDRPGVVFFKKCVNAIRTIPSLPRSQRDMEDVDETAETHAFDGVRYLMQYRRPKIQVVRLGGI